ncbi:MAG: 23S rRNA (adenine(2503)-C(2))-methyltransferase RlmN [Thermomicrobium sp.]|nr:23S rRNA (adenine(2503)-C(2))-methyltransferase RlmN [Thermomicrobium sp.]
MLPNAERSSVKTTLLGLSRSELAEWLLQRGEPKEVVSLRARQLFHWLYVRGETAPSRMTSLPKHLRELLEENAHFARPTVRAEQSARDGTRKWLLSFRDGREVETVFIPEENRAALCVSTQVGCSLSCKFCHTGTMRLVRNLTAGEILAQILVARDRLNDWPSPRSDRRITNVVVMGMGEPLLNYREVAAALRIVVDGDGIGISRRRVTLSTSGVVPRIGDWGRELGTNLAISLHAVRDDLRNELVPINRKWPIAALLEACRRYPAPRPITFEYVMLRGINDSDADARELVRLLRGIKAKVNLIPFNPWPGSPYRCSKPDRIRSFAAIVEAGGYPSPVRAPRGRDILAACGQLETTVEQRRSTVAISGSNRPSEAHLALSHS